jgi:ribosomal-protein-alanine acetyltransferase
MFSIIKIAYETLPERYNPMIFNYFYESFPQGFLVAEKNKKIIGFIIGAKTSNKTVRIPILAVRKEYRRTGIGSALLNKLFEILILGDIELVDLEVRTNNKIAIKFYKKHGFILSEKISGFYQSGEDANIMRKSLLSN